MGKLRPLNCERGAHLPLQVPVLVTLQLPHEDHHNC